MAPNESTPTFFYFNGTRYDDAIMLENGNGWSYHVINYNGFWLVGPTGSKLQNHSINVDKKGNKVCTLESHHSGPKGKGRYRKLVKIEKCTDEQLQIRKRIWEIK